MRRAPSRSRTTRSPSASWTTPPARPRSGSSLLRRVRILPRAAPHRRRSAARRARARPDDAGRPVGCGFDTRAFRLGGGRWLEVDEPELIAAKEARLPADEAPNELVRVGIRFGTESLEATLTPYASTEGVAIVLEGILGYLPDNERRALLDALGRLFPRHIVLCDLLTRTFLARYARDLVRFLREMDAGVLRLLGLPGGALPRARLPHARFDSILERSAELGADGAPPAWLFRLLPDFERSYCVWELQREVASRSALHSSKSPVSEWNWSTGLIDRVVVIGAWARRERDERAATRARRRGRRRPRRPRPPVRFDRRRRAGRRHRARPVGRAHERRDALAALAPHMLRPFTRCHRSQDNSGRSSSTAHGAAVSWGE